MSAPPTAARAWIVFTAGVFAYLCAVVQRSTLGVAGVAAAHRFDASAAALSTLGVLQLAVYALLQVPVGVLVDRFGPRTVIAGGAALMIAGQVTVGLATALPGAVVGRAAVGAGDATTFVAALRLVNAWFPARRVPVLSQWLGNLGQLGQILSAVPFAAALSLAGWTPAFLGAAGLSVLALVVTIAAVADTPTGRRTGPADLRAALAGVRASVRRPGTRLGFWAHFVTQSSGVVYALFWGYPFLVEGVGLAPAAASALLSVQVFAGFAVGPMLGSLTARFPFRRSNLVLAIVTGLALAWALVLLWPGSPPVAALVLLAVALGVGGPGSQIGFDYARTFNPASSLGGASGFVNVGGFSASFSMMFLIGVLLDAQHAVTGAPLYSLGAFKVAFAVQYLVVGVAVVRLLAVRKAARREQGVPIGPVWAALGHAARARVPARRRDTP